MIIKQLEFFFTHINRLMLHQDNGKNLSTKETIVVSQRCLKFLGSPVTCGSQSVKHYFMQNKDFSNLQRKMSYLCNLWL